MGYDLVCITGHPFAADGYAPSPLTLLGATAGRTKTVKLSTDILLTPLYHPVRLAEDVATIDILSNGRAMLGLGIGYRDTAWEALGTRRRERARRTEKTIDVLRGAWGEAPFTYWGHFFKVRDLVVTPKPVQKPHPPLWLASSSGPPARGAARFDLNLLPQGDLRVVYEPWLDELARLGRDPADYSIGLIKSWFVAESRSDPVWRKVAEAERYRGGTYQPWIAASNSPLLPEGPPQHIHQRYFVGGSRSSKRSSVFARLCR